MAIAVTGGAGAQAGTLASDQTASFTAALGASASVRLTMPGAAAASIAVLVADRLVGYDDEVPGDAAPAIAVGGLGAGDVPLIVVDAVHNDGPLPEPFDVTVTAR